MAHLKIVSKKRKFVADGVFYSELNEFLSRTLDSDGYAGVEVRVTPIRTEIIIRATRTREVLGEKGRRIRELTMLVQRRFQFRADSVELFAERVENKGCCAMAQAESLRYKLLAGLAVRRACYGVLRFVMDNEAKGVEVVVSGKLRAQRAKAMKFRDGYLISSGEPKNHYIDYHVCHVKMKQGVLGIKVKIMLAHDPSGRRGPTMRMPDNVVIHEPKEYPVELSQWEKEQEENARQQEQEIKQAAQAAQEQETARQEAEERARQEAEERARQEKEQQEQQSQQQQVPDEQQYVIIQPEQQQDQQQQQYQQQDQQQYQQPDQQQQQQQQSYQDNNNNRGGYGGGGGGGGSWNNWNNNRGGGGGGGNNWSNWNN